MRLTRLHTQAEREGDIGGQKERESEGSTHTSSACSCSCSHDKTKSPTYNAVAATARGCGKELAGRGEQKRVRVGGGSARLADRLYSQLTTGDAPRFSHENHVDLSIVMATNCVAVDGAWSMQQLQQQQLRQQQQQQLRLSL